MAIYTQLSLIATPGGIHSFVPISEKGEGLFTALSVLALPGGIHSFTAKSAVAEEKSITELSVFAVPGRRHIFLPKSIVIPVPEEPELIFDAGGGVTGKIQEDFYRWRQRDDEEILNIVMTIVLSGRL